MDELLKQNLSGIQSTPTDDWKKKILAVDSVEEPNYKVFNEIKLHEEGSSPLIVVFGVDNFNAIKTIESDLRRYTAIIVEPDLKKLKHLLTNKNVTELLSTRNIVFLAGEAVQELASELERYFSIAMIDNIKSINPIPERRTEFSHALDRLNTFTQTADYNRETVDLFLTDWYIHFAQNAYDFLHGRGLNQLEDQLNGQTATIVGPSPSLDNHIDELETLSDGWLICLDTALPILNELNIVPDYVVSVDVGEATLKYLENFPENSTFVCPSYMNSDYLEFADEVILFDINFPPNDWLRTMIDSPGFLALSGSVASAAMDLVRTLGPSECYLIGIDLAVPDLFPYSKYSNQFKRSFKNLNRFHHIPDEFLDQLSERFFTKTKSPWGELLTTNLYQQWQESFERFIDYSSFNFYRIGEKMAPIEGARMTKRIRDFNPKVDVSTPTKDGSRIKDPEEFQTQLESLLNTVEQFQVKFQTIGSRLDRDQDVTSEWLKIVREFGNDSTFTEYFQWEVDRLTQELQEATDKTDNSLQETLKEQYERWNKLLNATSDGLGRLI